MAKRKSIASAALRAKKYPPPADFRKKAHIKSLRAYQRIHRRSVEDP
ncbi:MAG: hypothetical protein GY849_11515, partial [Deltaproteobacteria bacterium]|nr:hypothetical protein [Deltaproteobacteria bacterium]